MRSIAVLLAFFVFSAAQAQHSYKFKRLDIDPTKGYSSRPGQLTQLNDNIIFTANYPPYGEELWVTDGTMSRTSLLADVRYGNVGSNPVILSTLSNKLFFSADDNINGRELWVADGSIFGTTMLMDINPGSASSNVYEGIVYNGKYYFTADNGINGEELWVTDGTVAGTKLFKDIDTTVGSSPDNFCIFKGKLYFRASDAIHGSELWSTDGTPAGTAMVKDINPSGSSGPENFTVVGNSLFFLAQNSIWKTDGTAAGTVFVTGYNSNRFYSSNPFCEYQGKLCFFEYIQYPIGCYIPSSVNLSITDGTQSGTKLLDSFPASHVAAMCNLYVYNGSLYFSKDLELWRTDGTSAGTKMIKDMNNGHNGSLGLTNFMEYNGLLYFMDGQLWATDGTVNNVFNVRPSNAVKYNSVEKSTNFLHFTKDSMQYFQAEFDSTGYELWALKDIGPWPANTSNITHDNTFNLYPNPNTGSFTIETNNDFKNGSVSVYDMMGKEVFFQSQIPNSRFQITLNQPKGIYMVKLQLDGATRTKSVVVE